MDPLGLIGIIEIMEIGNLGLTRTYLDSLGLIGIIEIVEIARILEIIRKSGSQRKRDYMVSQGKREKLPRQKGK